MLLFEVTLTLTLSVLSHFLIVALNEAVCGGNPELVGLLLRHRDQQQAKVRAQDIPLLLEKLQSTQDYYIEMKWEFSSWSECCGGGRGWREGVEGRREGGEEDGKGRGGTGNMAYT